MLTNNEIKEIIDEAARQSHRITTRDVAYAILCMQIEDTSVAYRCIFGDDGQDDIYDRSDDVSYVKQVVDYAIYSKKGKTKKAADISFEENKEYMLKLKADTEKAMADGDIDKKDGLKILADLSVKLNDRFGVKDMSSSQIVNVLTKFNDICPYCNHEISRRALTKEEAMRVYNLTEN